MCVCVWSGGGCVSLCVITSLLIHSKLRPDPPLRKCVFRKKLESGIIYTQWQFDLAERSCALLVHHSVENMC